MTMADKDMMEFSFLDVPSFRSNKVKQNQLEGLVGSNCL
jgi:hypothetical protein